MMSEEFTWLQTKRILSRLGPTEIATDRIDFTIVSDHSKGCALSHVVRVLVEKRRWIRANLLRYAGFFRSR